MNRYLMAILVFTFLNTGLQAQKSTLIGGKPVKPNTYDAVVYISANGARCSSTIVGERALITAAHCSRSEGRVTFQHNRNQYSAICTGSPRYPREDYDVSMCVIDRVVTDVKPASIRTEQVKLGETVTMTGYGGTIKGSGKGGNDGTLREGEVKVTGFTKYDFITKGAVSSAFGDSGSGVFLQVKDAFNDHLWQVGVVSKGNIVDTSYLANLAVVENSSWIKSWSEAKKIAVCGITKDCVDTKPDPEPQPEPEPEDPEDQCKLERALNKFYSKKADASLEKLEACEAK